MNFTQDKIFESAVTNTFIDRIVYELIQFIIAEELSVNLKDVFALSGKAAAILQDDDDEPVKNIIFVCKDENIFNYIKTSKTLEKNRVVTKDSVFMYQGAFYEFHFLEEFTKIDINSISVQDITEIPTEYL